MDKRKKIIADIIQVLAENGCDVKESKKVLKLVPKVIEKTTKVEFDQKKINQYDGELFSLSELLRP